MKTYLILAQGCLAIACAYGAQAAPGPSDGDAESRNAVRDAFVPAWPEAMPEGYLGTRMKINLEKRLPAVEIDKRLLDPFRHKEGSWSGCYAGMFLDAAARAWRLTGNEGLKKKLDSTAADLIALQEPGGFLGTNGGEWEGFNQKYVLIGLLSHYRYTGNRASLDAARKLGDYLCGFYGPGKRSVGEGAHVGMTTRSLLQPIIWLYQITGDRKYLDFGLRVRESWRKELEGLRRHGDVQRTANGKAYELLSLLVAFLELYRVDGDKELLAACENAWSDIRSKRLYITGTTSWKEYFPKTYDLWAEEAARMGEGCVSAYWLQFNWLLLRLTGKPQYADELERTIYNALTGAQSPVTGRICYYMPLIGGSKPYDKVPTFCCLFNVPRGLALIPECIAGTVAGRPTLLLYEPVRVRLPAVDVLGKAVNVELSVETDFPDQGSARIVVQPAATARFSLQLRVPAWCEAFRARVGSDSYQGKAGRFLEIDRTWKAGDRIEVSMPMRFTVLSGGAGQPLGLRYPHKSAIQRGAQVLAADAKVSGPRLPQGWIGKQVYELPVIEDGQRTRKYLVPYADASQSGGRFTAIFGKIDLLPTKDE